MPIRVPWRGSVGFRTKPNRAIFAFTALADRPTFWAEIVSSLPAAWERSSARR
ncbi:hypothetical protein ABMY26_00680 (plasmid) [Azospirillum sp. HJ39]|uniref:hypothetical protein n=1 Tax=Azospirillum sp. HJ39 TaxID=3159496 RepID=UPI0035571567